MCHGQNMTGYGDYGHPGQNLRMGNRKILWIYLQCEAPKIAKLVHNSNNYGLWYL